MKGTWETTEGGGGGGLGTVVLVIVAAALLGPAIAVAVAELVHIVLIVLAVVAGLAGAAVVALAAYHVHRWRAGGPGRVSLPAPTVARAVQAPTEPRPAIEAPPAPGQRVEVHHHWHGVSPADVAAIIRQQEDQ